ncbi:hypothetical protein QR98_0031170 [Sarcoptes scabiei]|uniref:Uncharacterized protein n=1 Tax=Sarcoptes scabiei TaxID=52283 RepID=A0A132A0S5_SARSC|nr:hypothetical protein QR98_0031170 [Sarcoptes scabiei]
MADMDKEV